MSYKPLVADCQGACPGEPVEGGVCAARGFATAGLHAGFRRNPERSDLALVCAEAPVASAGVFTTNRFCAAPVQVDREHLSASGGRTRAIILNSAVANAATGGPGLDNARSTATQLAGLLGCECSEVLVASTGVIGTQLPMEVMAAGMPRVIAALGSDEGHDLDAARAIMTTDTKPKRAAMRYADASGITYTVGGMCKGSGMIAPNMATMLAVVTTDAPVAPAVLDAALHVAADASFNRVTVDGDTSTNDSCFLLASGAAGGEEIGQAAGPRYEAFLAALTWVCDELARQIAADGEGATRLVRVSVTGAATQADAELAARTVANSPLVKTAIAGHDANWGRIAAALGRSGAAFAQENVSIDILGLPVLRGGLPIGFDEEEALRRFEDPRVDIVCDLGAGQGSFSMWTCDLTHGYVSINADYRS